MKKKSSKKSVNAIDPDIAGSKKAIVRAAKRARERASRFGHGIIIYEYGEIVEVAVAPKATAHRKN